MSTDDIYRSTESISASSNRITSYKWTFTDTNSALENERSRKIREAVGDDTYGPTPTTTSDTQKSRRILGPSLPSSSDLQLRREEADSKVATERLGKRKRERTENKEWVEDMVGPKEVGRERMLEVKRVKREGDRAHRESKDDGGLEVSDDVLMGSGGSFKERYFLHHTTRCVSGFEFFHLDLPSVMQLVHGLKPRQEKSVEPGLKNEANA